MKKLFFALMLCAAVSVAGQSKPFTPYSALPKAEQKARLKAPAIVEIAAPAEKVSQLLVRALQAEGYQVTQSTPQSLWMTRDAKSTGASILGAMIGEGGFQYVVSYTFSEVN